MNICKRKVHPVINAHVEQRWRLYSEDLSRNRSRNTYVRDARCTQVYDPTHDEVGCNHVNIVGYDGVGIIDQGF